ncbi:MAG: primosomal protein N' [Anaerolineales bacterium]|nr:primosomal protein N' [Anaerolineae bacterium]PWB55756.1 MAG: primosomal protein N' [Anaerolineales bacterium]
MTTYVEVGVNVPQVSGTFHYHLPPELEGQIKPGHLVEVPFSRQRVQGVVFRLVDQPEVPETKPVTALLDPLAVLTPQQIRLAGELSESTLAPLAACIDAMIPPGLAQQADTLYQKSTPLLPVAHPLTSLQNRMLNLISERGPLRARQLDSAFRHVDWRPAARSLVNQGLLSTQTVLPGPAVGPKTVRTAQLTCTSEQAEADMPRLSRSGSPALRRRQAILSMLLREPGEVEAAWLYAESGGNLTDLQALEKRGLVRLGEAQVWRDPLESLDFVASQPPKLTNDQLSVWNTIEKGIQQAATVEYIKPFLLHGVTGSGKTEIYLRSVEATLQLGRQAIVLVPEIALTPQTIRRFVSRFPGLVGSMHSRLSQGERFDTWRRARLGEISLIVGPRSALFTPFANVGLIVVDEFHDDTYYQFDLQPHYHARDVAVRYAQLTGAVCVLGSATPDIVSRYRAEKQEWHYLSLPQRILAHRKAVENQVKKLGISSHYQPVSNDTEFIELPPVQVVDMRTELQNGNRSIFSLSLQQALEKTLAHNLQAILFLNRRGSATYIFCRDCGYILKCPRCDLPLTYHMASPRLEQDAAASPDSLTCHYCFYKRQMPKTCPQCGSERIRQYGTGTEKVQAEVNHLFPTARTLRWDFETTRQKGAHDLILANFVNHQADVLIGTQMIAKGLDLPLVTLVGAVLADVGLSLPDVRAAERTFQVLTQVAGRAGRSPLGGQVILQTFLPEHYVIQAASRHDYQAFYHQELEYRRQLHYPPFSQLVRLEYRHRDVEHAESAANIMAQQVRRWLEEENRLETELVGPTPCFFSRLAGLYRWQIVLRGPDPASLLRGRHWADWRVEVNPPSIL